MQARLPVRGALALASAAIISITACERKPGPSSSAPAPVSGATVPPADATPLAAGLWAKLISADPAVVAEGWRELAKVDAPALRRAVYDADEPPNDQLRVGGLAFQLDTPTMKRWDNAYTEAFPAGSEEAAARACIALDSLAAGVMASGSTFGGGVAGARAYPYERALLTRMYALGKLAKLDPHGSEHDPKGKMEKVQAIAKSGQVAKDVP